MRYKSSIDMAGFAYDYIKQVYKNCDNKDLEPIWLHMLDQFINSVNNRDIFTTDLKYKLMKDLKGCQCKSKTSQQVFDEYFSNINKESAQEFVYDDLIQDLYNSFLDAPEINKFLNVQNYSELKDAIIPTKISSQTMRKLIKNIDNYSVEELITIFYENFNVVQDVNKYAHLGVSEKSLKNINRMGRMFFKGKLKQVLLIIKKIDANLKTTLKNNVKEITIDRFGRGKEDDFDNVINIDFNWNQEVSNKTLYEYTLNTEYMELYNKTRRFVKGLKSIYGVSEEEINYCIKVSIQAFVEKNALNASNVDKVDQLIKLGYMVPAREKVLQPYIMEMTEQDINTILSLPKYVVENIGRTQNAINWHKREMLREEGQKNKQEDDIIVAAIEQYAQTISPELRQFISKLEQHQKEQNISTINRCLELSIKRFMEISEFYDNNEQLVAGLRARGFDYPGARTDYRYRGLLLSKESVELILGMPTEMLTNINKLNSVLKHKERLIATLAKKEEEKQALQQQEMERKQAIKQARLDAEEAERLKKEDARARYLKRKEKLRGSPEYQQAILYKTEGSEIWKQVDVIFKSITNNNYESDTTSKERAYWFNELDMFLVDCESIDELIKCAEHRRNVIKFREIKKDSANVTNWNRVLNFLQNVKECSVNKPIMSRIEFKVGNKLTQPTKEQENIVKEYLKQNNVPINETTYFNALRRLIIGGDINTKFDSNYLTSITDTNVK